MYKIQIILFLHRFHNWPRLSATYKRSYFNVTILGLMLEVIHQMKLIMPIIFSIANKRRQSNSDLECNYIRVTTRACMIIILPVWKGVELVIRCFLACKEQELWWKMFRVGKGRETLIKNVFDVWGSLQIWKEEEWRETLLINVPCMRGRGIMVINVLTLREK